MGAGRLGSGIDVATGVGGLRPIHGLFLTDSNTTFDRSYYPVSLFILL
jgi:hypothetical protein